MSEGFNKVDVGAKLFGALAHPTRLQLLEELCIEEECVCHLSALFKKPQPYISQQLAELRQEGLVLDRRGGQRVFYRLRDKRVADLIRTASDLVSGITSPRQQRRRVENCPCPKCAPLRGQRLVTR